MLTGNRSTLFRQRATEQKLLGPQAEPVIAISNQLRLQILFAVVLLLLASFLLTKTRYKETVPARGLLQAKAGAQTILSPASGRVKYIYFAPGDWVEKGEVLAELSSEIHGAQGVSVIQQNKDRLQDTKQMLLRQLAKEENTRDQSRLWHKNEAEYIRRIGMGIAVESELLDKQLEMNAHSLQAISQLLESGNSSRSEFDQQNRFHLDLLAKAEEISLREIQLARELDTLEHGQQLAESDFEKSILQLRLEIHSVEQSIQSLAHQSQFTVVAEQSGFIAEIGLELGKPVLANQPLFFIRPRESELVATLFVNSATQGQLFVGQSVMLRLDAFDYREFGRQDATISSIGEAPLDPRQTQLPIAGIREPVFRVQAQLDMRSVAGAENSSLQEGSTLMADFIVAEKSLLEFIVNPLLELRGKVT